MRHPQLACRHAGESLHAPLGPASMAAPESLPGRPWLSVLSHPERTSARKTAKPRSVGRRAAANESGEAGEGVWSRLRSRFHWVLESFNLPLDPGLREGRNNGLGGGLPSAPTPEDHGAELGRHGDHCHPAEHLLELQANRGRDGTARDLPSQRQAHRPALPPAGLQPRQRASAGWAALRALDAQRTLAYRYQGAVLYQR